MKRFALMGLFFAAGIALLTAGCAHNGFATVAVTKDASVVASCQGMGEVKASTLTPDSEAQRDLTDAARAKGANTILMQSHNARTAMAYQCAMPAPAAAQATSEPSR